MKGFKSNIIYLFIVYQSFAIYLCSFSYVKTSMVSGSSKIKSTFPENVIFIISFVKIGNQLKLTQRVYRHLPFNLLNI